MKTAATKERSFFSLAAFVLLAAALLAPSAEASRYLPNALAPSEAPAPLLELDQVDAEAFPLFSETDVRLINALAFLDTSEAARLSAEKRLRPIEDPGEIARPAELAAIRKLASGVLTCESETNILQTGGLSQNCGSPSFQGLWTDPSTGLSYARNRWYDARTASWLSEDPMGDVDSPNLYAFVAWGPHVYTDPMGLDHGDVEAARAAKVRSDEWCALHPEECAADRARGEAILMVGQAALEYVAAGEAAAVGAFPVALAGGAHASDVLVAAGAQFVSGKPQNTLTSQGLENMASGLGASPERARQVGQVGDVLAGGVSVAFSMASVNRAMARSGLSVPVSVAEETPSTSLPPVRVAGATEESIAHGPNTVGAAQIPGRRSWASRPNAELVQDIGRRADLWGTRRGLISGNRAGTRQHSYAEAMLNRYQRRFGDRGLTTEVRYIRGRPWQSGQGVRGSVRLDVVEGDLRNPIAIYDYKFGTANLPQSRIDQIRRVGGFSPDVPVIGVNIP